jgi:hypothetical protein
VNDREDPEPADPGESGLEPAQNEPEWAAEIHRLRRARGRRLKRIFATFDDDERQEEP